MADNKYKILLRRGNESDLNTAFYDIGEPIFLSDSGKLLIKKNDGTMAEFVVSDDAKENTSNKVQEINFPSSDYYPSTKAVFDYVNSKLETPLSDIESLKSGKLDKTDFNTYKTATDKVVGDNADNIKLLDTNKANVVISYNLFDWSILNGCKKDGLYSVAMLDGSYHITGMPSGRYIALFTTEIKLEDGEYSIATNSNSANCYAQIRITNTDGKDNYYINNSFTVDNSKIKKITLTVQSGSDVSELNAVINPYLCKIEDKDKFILPNKIAEGVYPFCNQIINHYNNELQKRDDKITSLAIKNTTEKASDVVISDSSDSNIIDLKLYNENANLYMCGKNLADFNTYFAKAQGWTTVGTGSADTMTITRNTDVNTITFNSINAVNRSGVNVSWNNSGIPVSLLLGKKITVSVNIETTDDCKFFLCNSCDNYKSTTTAVKANVKQRTSVTTTMPTDVDKIKNTSILFHIDGTITNVTLSNFQIELSSNATSYEDYKGSQTVTNTTDMSTVHTYYPTTTIISDSDFEVTYIADTKSYIDNKILEVATALVAHESEVN